MRRAESSTTRKLLAGFALCSVLSAPACAGPPQSVDEITLVNPTPYDVDTDVSTPAKRQWLPLALLPNRGSTTVQDVIDHGDQWVFRFSHAGVEGGSSPWRAATWFGADGAWSFRRRSRSVSGSSA